MSLADAGKRRHSNVLFILYYLYLHKVTVLAAELITNLRVRLDQ